MLRLILVGALLGIRAQGRVDSGGVRLPAVRAGLCLDRCLPTLRDQSRHPERGRSAVEHQLPLLFDRVALRI